MSAFVALGGALFGFDIASMSAILGTEQYQNYYGKPHGARHGGITSAMEAGSVVGALSSTVPGDKGVSHWSVGLK
ncbi:hypothetical protein V1522DRAFT_410890 [Lipomyces starkeyi]